MVEKEDDLVATGICPSFPRDRLEACPTSLYQAVGATDLGLARSVPAFWEKGKVVHAIEHPIEKRVDGKLKMGIFRFVVAIELEGSTDLARPRSVAPNTESTAGPMLRLFRRLLRLLLFRRGAFEFFDASG
jgi:hypothetical protein